MAFQEPPLHSTHVPVRWSDFDRFGHMNNLAYIELAHEARNIFAMDAFVRQGHEVPAVFLKKVEAEYLRPILPDATTVIVETEVTAIGNTSFTTRQYIKDIKGNVCCIVTCVQIAVDLHTSSPRELNPKERTVLQALNPGSGAAES